jgi:trk system potassium uptake protein TrkH
MNVKIIGRMLSFIIAIEAVFMLPAMALNFADGETRSAFAFIVVIAGMLLLAGLTYLLCKGCSSAFYASEGFACVGLGWTLMSVFGCLPFVISGEIPNFVDAFFETVSGFTTTGASILPNVEVISRGMLYWRGFTHWLGGMGMLVFLLAVIPMADKTSGYTMHILRAESPGPSVDKLAPRMRKTARLLYGMYIFLSVANYVCLRFARMPAFDALCIMFASAGTGGFGVRADSLASYTPAAQIVTIIFPLLFGANFSIYYMLIIRKFRAVLRNEELRLYLAIFVLATAAIALNIRGYFATFGEVLRHAAFQVSTIMTTTGFSTTDSNLWPPFSKAILLCLMITGACAGSTGGGIKCARLLLYFKSLLRNVRQLLHPNRVEMVRVNGQVIPETVLKNTNAYLVAYMIISVASVLIISVDGFSVESNLSAVLACFNNIGPGFDAFGVTSNYAALSVLSKLVLSFDMLCGRLEIFPILALLTRSAWSRKV